MSTLRADSIANRAGTGPAGLVGQSAAKAFINFDGTNTTNHTSLNVSSRTNNGTADYTINLTQSLSSANYAATFGALGHPSTAAGDARFLCERQSGKTASTLRVIATNTATLVDTPSVSVVIHGDLA